MKKHCVAKDLLAILEILLHENNVALIPTDLQQVGFDPLFVVCYQTKTKITFSASWWSGNEKYFFFLSLASHSLFQNHVEFNRLL